MEIRAGLCNVLLYICANKQSVILTLKGQGQYWLTQGQQCNQIMWIHFRVCHFVVNQCNDKTLNKNVNHKVKRYSSICEFYNTGGVEWLCTYPYSPPPMHEQGFHRDLFCHRWWHHISSGGCFGQPSKRVWNWDKGLNSPCTVDRSSSNNEVIMLKWAQNTFTSWLFAPVLLWLHGERRHTADQRRCTFGCEFKERERV